jgi:hypothetical protein
MTDGNQVPERKARYRRDVSRMCPATDRKKVREDGHCRSANLLVKGTVV